MATIVLPGDVVCGNLSATSVTLPAGTVTDASVKAAAGIQASKVQHQHQKGLSQVSGSAATTERRVVHVVRGATATIYEFACTVPVANVGAATITFDLRKNGTTVLSAVVSFSSGDAAYAVKTGTITVPSAVAGDVLEVVITATAGGGTLGQAACGQATVREDAA